MLSIVIALCSACGTPLPDAIAGFETRCIELTTDEVPPHDDDPHEGFKRVYACDLTLDQLVDETGATRRPFPEGTLIVKSSRRDGQDFSWLVATAHKEGGVWDWAEYTRNFVDEELRLIPAGPEVCVDCHRGAQSLDWIFTSYQPRQQ